MAPAQQNGDGTTPTSNSSTNNSYSPEPIGAEPDADGILGISRRSRMELDIMNALHNTGVQFDIDLPQIIAVGMQSSGKSSLIEAFSGTSLPRAVGTCTRCPTECRLSRSDSPWKCVVSLRFIADSNGRPLGQTRNEKFGEVIYNKNQVEERVRRAQRAILNPDKSAELFLHGVQDDTADQEESQLTFSINCVTLEISGPKVADLSFCDLPGLIASVSGGQGSSNDITLVENLVTSYMKKPSCIILLAVACETDFENQGAHRLAKQYDPSGLRTIGVLTKPDRIPHGEEQNWIQFIRNDKEPLKNNWFSVKQPSSQELKANIPWAKARENENLFFTRAPWSELESTYQSRLGTQKLVERLSHILSDLISERIPQIREILETSIINTRDLFSQLPRPPSEDPRTEILMMIYNFATDIGRHVEGVPDDGDSTGLIQSIRPEHEIFRRAIQNTAPTFNPLEKGVYTPPPEMENSPQTREYSDNHIHIEEVFRRANSPQTREYSDDHIHIDEVFRRANSPQTREYSDDLIHIDEVLRRANSARTRELPGHYPFSVQRTFIKSFVKKWHAPSLMLSKTVFDTVSEHVDDLMSKHFGGFGQGLLERRVSAIVHLHVKQCLDRAEDRINWLLRVEELPFSLNINNYADYRSKFLAQYRGVRQMSEQSRIMQMIEQHSPQNSTTSNSTYVNGRYVVEQQPTAIAKVMGALAELGLAGIKAQDLPKLFPPDRMEPAMNIMADVSAYFEVAYKRYVDNVPLAIDLELVRGIEENLIELLMSGLGINGPEGGDICKEFAQENPQTADRRAELQKKLERLENAHRELLFPGL